MSRFAPSAASLLVKGPSREGSNERTQNVHIHIERAPNLDPASFQRVMTSLHGLGRYVEQCGLEHSLLDLIKTRASQINGCAMCIDMHTKDARARGESE